MSRVALTEAVFRPTNPASFGRGLEVSIFVRGTEEVADIFSKETGGSKLTQPLIADSAGRPRGEGDVLGWLDDGSYDLCIVDPARPDDDPTIIPFEAAKGGAAIPRITSITSSAEPEIKTDELDQFNITALATAITSMTAKLKGTPADGQKLIVRILDNGTARAITWGASFVSRSATLPTTTIAGKYLYLGFVYNSVAAKWDCVAVGYGF